MFPYLSLSCETSAYADQLLMFIYLLHLVSVVAFNMPSDAAYVPEQ